MAVLAHIVTALSLLAAPPAHVSSAEIKEAVRAHVLERLGVRPDDVLIEFRGAVRDIDVADGPVRLIVGSDGMPRVRGSMSIPVDVVAGDAVVRRLLVSLRVRTYGDVLVAARLLDRGDILRPADVVRQRVETTDLPDDRIVLWDDCTEKQTARVVTAGTVLRRSLLEPLPIVHRGERVILAVRGGAVVLESEVIATADAVLGASVIVKKPTTHERLVARAVGPKRVEIVVP